MEGQLTSLAPHRMRRSSSIADDDAGPGNRRRRRSVLLSDEEIARVKGGPVVAIDTAAAAAADPSNYFPADPLAAVATAAAAAVSSGASLASTGLPAMSMLPPERAMAGDAGMNALKFVQGFMVLRAPELSGHIYDSYGVAHGPLTQIAAGRELRGGQLPPRGCIELTGPSAGAYGILVSIEKPRPQEAPAQARRAVMRRRTELAILEALSGHKYILQLRDVCEDPADGACLHLVFEPCYAIAPPEAGVPATMGPLAVSPGVVTLADYLKRGPLSEPHAAGLFRCLLKAVFHGHNMGVTHRAIQPGACVLEANGRDLTQVAAVHGAPSRATLPVGQAAPHRMTAAAAAAAVEDAVVAATLKLSGWDAAEFFGLGLPPLPPLPAAGPGSPTGAHLAYLAPEILAAKPAAAGGRRDGSVAGAGEADMWACGVVLYEMLTGSTPFLPAWASGAGTAEMVLKAIHQGQLKLDVPTGLPGGKGWEQATPEARSLVRGLLHIDPGARLLAREALLSPWLWPEYHIAVAERAAAGAPSPVSAGPPSPAIAEDGESSPWEGETSLGAAMAGLGLGGAAAAKGLTAVSVGMAAGGLALGTDTGSAANVGGRAGPTRSNASFNFWVTAAPIGAGALAIGVSGGSGRVQLTPQAEQLTPHFIRRQLSRLPSRVGRGGAPLDIASALNDRETAPGAMAPDHDTLLAAGLVWSHPVELLVSTFRQSVHGPVQRLLQAPDSATVAAAADEFYGGLCGLESLFESFGAPAAEGPFFQGAIPGLAEACAGPAVLRMLAVLPAVRNLDCGDVAHRLGLTRLGAWLAAIAAEPGRTNDMRPAVETEGAHVALALKIHVSCSSPAPPPSASRLAVGKERIAAASNERAVAESRVAAAAALAQARAGKLSQAEAGAARTDVAGEGFEAARRQDLALLTAIHADEAAAAGARAPLPKLAANAPAWAQELMKSYK